MRIFVGVGAWLLGVGAATGGSLLAVSLLGQGIAAGNTQQLTEAAVTRALASESTEASQPGQPTASLPAATASTTRSPRAQPPTTPPPEAGVSPSDRSASARPSSSRSPHQTGASATPTPSPTQSAPPSAVLTSQGGTVVAECLPAGAYLLSWSPTQGYEVGPVLRGPAPTAQAVFDSSADTVTMVVSCSTGVPTATTTVSGGNGGGGHDE